MEFIISLNTIKKAVSSIQSICQKKTVNEFTGYALFIFSEKFCTIKATDIESFMQINFDISSKSFYEETVKIMVNTKRFYDLIKDLSSDNIILEIQKEIIIIKSDHCVIELSLTDPEQFPIIDQKNVENIFSIKNKILYSMISYSINLTIVQSNRVGIGSGKIFIEIKENSLKMTSTDGHCLSHCVFDIPMNANIDFLISRKAALDLKKALELEDDETEIIIGRSNDGEIVFGTNNLIFFIKPIKEKFPHYKPIIDTNNKVSLYFEIEELEAVSKRLNCIAEGKFIPSTMEYANDSSFINASILNKGVGSLKESFKVILSAKENQPINEITTIIKIYFYSAYILQAVSSLKIGVENLKNGEKSELFINNEKKPIILYKKDVFEKFYAVMPMIF